MKKGIPFFENRSGLWSFLALPLAIVLYLLSNSGTISNSGDYQHNNSIVNSGTMSGITVAGENNTISVVNNEIKRPTLIEEKQASQWEKCETKLRAFYRRLDRDDIKSARALFDEHMTEANVFLEERLTKFISDRVAGNFAIEEVSKGGIDDSEYVARCEFNYRLEYTDKTTNKLRNDMGGIFT